MRRALVIAAILTTAPASAPGQAQELRREVFPVPDVVGAAFRGGGLAAFDPFNPWQPGTAVPSRLLTASATGEDGARLPEGACFDIVPAWTARGFNPHEGTRVLYHPQSQMLYAKIAPADEMQVRAFCDWPAAMWMSDTYWGEATIRQILLRTTTHEVPATGAGAWQFHPASVAELLALPEPARRTLHRQSMVIRGGQRSKGEGVRRSQQNWHATPGGGAVEAECTVGEDGSTVDLNVAPEFGARLANGNLVVLRSSFQQLIQWGDSWLMEAGTLPGTPQRRIFQVFEVLRVHPEMRDRAAFNRCLERWTGRKGEGVPPPETVTGQAFSSYDFSLDWVSNSDGETPGGLLPAAKIYKWEQPPADPFATPEPPKNKPLIEELPVITVPEFFGDVPVCDVTRVMEEKTGIPRGLIRAWQRPDGGRLYVKGTAGGLTALGRWLELTWSVSARTAMAEASLKLTAPGAPAPGKTVWQASVPVRAGQRSRIDLKSGQEFDDWQDYNAVFPCYVEMEADCEELPGPVAGGAPISNWTLRAGGYFLPPYVDAPVVIGPQSETGDHDGVTLVRTIGRSAAGEDIVLTVRLRGVTLDFHQWTSSATGDWWWRRQLAKAAR